MVVKTNRKYPTKEEAIKIISSVFTPNQLKQLEVTHKGQTITFEEQLLVEFVGYFSKYSFDELYVLQKKKLLDLIEEYLKHKQLNTFVIFFSKTNPEKQLYEQTEEWKTQQKLNTQKIKHYWISCISAVAAIISAVSAIISVFI